MAPHREIVVLSGRLTGMGREARCTLNAVKVSLPGTNISRFVRWRIHHAPSDLPEGQYRVTFEGETLAFQKRGGVWRTLDGR